MSTTNTGYMTTFTDTYATPSGIVAVSTNRLLTTMAVGRGRVVQLPAQVPGISMTTQQALGNALAYVSPAEIHDELVSHWEDAEAVDATQAQVIYHFTAWLAGFGDWSE